MAVTLAAVTVAAANKKTTDKLELLIDKLRMDTEIERSCVAETKLSLQP